MITNAYATKHGRGPNACSHKAIERITSADGNRWAYKTLRKRQIAGRQYSIVEVWVIKERRDGRVITVHSGTCEQIARQFVA